MSSAEVVLDHELGIEEQDWHQWGVVPKGTGCLLLPSSFKGGIRLLLDTDRRSSGLRVFAATLFSLRFWLPRSLLRLA